MKQQFNKCSKLLVDIMIYFMVRVSGWYLIGVEAIVFDIEDIPYQCLFPIYAMHFLCLKKWKKTPKVPWIALFCVDETMEQRKTWK